MRKELLVILSLFWLLACNSGMESDAMKSMEATEEEIPIATDEIDQNVELPEAVLAPLDYELIASEKLQEYADLQNLKSEHPTFEMDLRKQLMALSADTLFSSEENEKVELSDVQILNAPRILSDSITEVKLKFNIQTKTTSKTDSVLAIFQKKTVTIDGSMLTSTKVTFESLRN